MRALNREKMGNKSQAAKHLTYAQEARSRSGRFVIRALENLTGRLGLMMLARGYERDIAQGRDFWDVMIDRCRLDLDIVGGIENIPAEGPVILVANHPFGILDGLIMGHVLQKRRGSFRILANQVFSKADDVAGIVLPVDFAPTEDAVRTNIETRKAAVEFLAQGGAIGIFPGGTVSTSRKAFGPAMDPGWRSFTARMIQKSGAQVVPVYFDGANSRLFQLVSRLHPNLRLGLLLQELRRRIGGNVRVVIGQPVDSARLQAFGSDSRTLMDFLRFETYRLSPRPLADYAYGYEFEKGRKEECLSEFSTAAWAG